MRLRAEVAGAVSALALGLAGAIGFCVLLPEQLPAISQLSPYLAVALVVVALLFVMARRPFRAILCVLVAAAAFTLAYRDVEAVSAGATGPSAGPDFKLISFNALHTNQSAPTAVPYLLGSGADAILLMEADEMRGSMPALMAVYPYKMGCDERAKCDTVLLSKYPPTVAWKASLGAVFSERYIQFGIRFHERNVTLIGAHLSKPYFDDLALIELSVLAERINRLNGPVILAGDFNSAPWSWSLREFSRQTGLKFGDDLVGTWPVALGAVGIPIDHVLARSAAVTRLEPMPSAFGSNHRGLVATIALGPDDRPRPSSP